MRAAAFAAVLLASSCTALSHDRDSGPLDVPAFDVPVDVPIDVAPDVPLADCGPAVTDRDVSVLFVVQSLGVVEQSRFASVEAARALPTLLRHHTNGTIRMAGITGDAGPGGLRGSCVIEGRDGVFLSGRERPETSMGPIATLPPGAPVEPFVEEAVAILDDASNDECMNQVLESTARALTPTTVPLELPAHGSVHGDLENAGLVSPGGILLVVFVTDAEDCSWNERVTSSLPDGMVPCLWPDRCCPEVLYPSAARYVPAFRNAAAALGVDVGFALISGLPEADVSLAEWRSRGEPRLCTPITPDIYAGMPWRILETLDAFEPFVTTQPRCDPNYQAIADLVPAIACATE